MKIIELKNLIRKDFPIYYRRLYSGIVVLDFLNKVLEVSLDFQIEHKPTGHKEIKITSLGNIDYPLVPLQKEIKKVIGEHDSNGMLPN